MANLATITTNILADSGIDDINVIVSTGSYTNPSWIVSLPWTKITGTPTTLAGYGITDAYTQTQVDTLLNAKQNALTLTTTGTSGAATLVGATLNIPQYQSVITNPVTGTGTAGQVAYWSSASAITGESNLFWDATNDRLGIATVATVSAALDVKSYIQIDTYAAGTTVPNLAGYLRIVSAGKTGWAPNDELGKIEFFGSDTSGIGPRNLASIRAVNSQGNGTSTATSNGELAFYTSATNSLEAERLRIAGTGEATFSSSVTTLAAFIAKGNGLYQNGTTNILNVGTDQNMYGVTNSDGGVFVYGNNKLFLSTNSVRRLTVDGGGNVGIGTTSPNIGNRAGAGTLTVRNNSTYAEIEISGSSSSQGGVLSFYGDTTKYAEMTGEFQSSNNGMMIFRTRSSGTVSERMRITAAGRVLIGTPPPAESTFQLDVNGAGRFSGELFTSLSNGVVRLRDNGTAQVEVNIRHTSTRDGVLSFTQDGVADRWAIGTKPSDGTLYFSANFDLSTPRLTLTSAGAATFSSLAGTGTRMVVANATGVLSTQAITVGTVTSVAALTIGTTGTNITSTVANGTTTPVITLNVPNASAANRGALTAADWTTFNNKQNALTNPVTGTGSTGQVAYFNGTSSITSESTLFWDATNDRLGISNPSPSVKLDVFLTTGTGYQLVGRFLGGTNANGNAGGIALGSTQTAAGYIYGEQTASTGGDLVFGNQRAGVYAEGMRLTSSGNLGLGVTPSGWGSLSRSMQIGSRASIFSFNNGTSDIGLNVFWNSSNTDYHYIQTGVASFYRQSSGEHIWYNAPSGTFNTAISFTQAMTLFTNGGLSIGTPGTAPAQGLLVVGAAIFSSTIRSNATNGFAIGSIAGYRRIQYDLANTRFGLLTDGDALANLEAAAATFSSSVTATQFVANGNSAGGFEGLRIINASTGAAQIVLNNSAQSWFVNTRTDNQFSIFNATSSTTPFLIATSGAATFSSSVTTGGGIQTNISKSGSGIENVNFLQLRLFGTNAIGDSLDIRYLNSAGNNIANISAILGGDNVAYGSLAFSTRNFFTDSMVEVMRINNRGNVGIGTASPTTRLDIGNGTLTLPTLRGRTYTLSNVASANPNFINGTGFNAIPVRVGDIIDLPFSQTRTVTAVTDTQITVNAAWTTSFAGVNVEGRGAIVFQTNNLDRLTIAGTGNVGIGTSAFATSDFFSSVPLQVNSISGNIALRLHRPDATSGAGVGGLSFAGNDSSGNQRDIALIQGETSATNSSGGALRFLTRANAGSLAERMRITSGGNVLIGTTTTPTPVSGVAFPLTLSSSAATRLRIDSTNASPNSGVGLYANGVQKFSFAMYGTDSDFTIYNDSLLAPALTVKGTNSNVLIGTTTSTGAKLEINGDIRTGTLDTGYVSGFWKLGRAVIGTQPSETHQIIVEINGQLYVIGAAQL